MAGDANDAGFPKISMSITCSREAFWEAMWKKISSPFAVSAIGKSMSELKVKIPRGSSEAKNNLRSTNPRIARESQ